MSAIIKYSTWFSPEYTGLCAVLLSDQEDRKLQTVIAKKCQEEKVSEATCKSKLECSNLCFSASARESKYLPLSFTHRCIFNVYVWSISYKKFCFYM